MAKTEVNIKSGGNNILLAAVSILFVIASIACSFLYHRYSKEKSKLEKSEISNSRMSRTISSLEDSTRTYRVKLSDGEKVWASETETTYMKEEHFRKLLSEKSKEAERLGFRIKDLESEISVSSVATGSGNDTVYVDSMKQVRLHIEDGFLTETVSLFRDRHYEYSYSYNDDFDIFMGKKPHRFLFFRWKSKDNDKAVVIFKNPNQKGKRIVKVNRID